MKQKQKQKAPALARTPDYCFRHRVRNPAFSKVLPYSFFLIESLSHALKGSADGLVLFFTVPAQSTPLWMDDGGGF